METLKQLMEYDSMAQRVIKRWESDPLYRQKQPIAKYLNTLTDFVTNHIAKIYYLLDNHIEDEDGKPVSLYQATMKLSLLRSIRKVAIKENKQEIVDKLTPVIKDFETKIEEKSKEVKLLKPKQ